MIALSVALVVMSILAHDAYRRYLTSKIAPPTPPIPAGPDHTIRFEALESRVEDLETETTKLAMRRF